MRPSAPLLPLQLLPLLWATLPLAGLGCRTTIKDSGLPPTSTATASQSWVEVGTVATTASAFAVDEGTLWAVLDGQLRSSSDGGTSWSSAPTAGLPPGEPTWVGAAEGAVLTEVPGGGIFVLDGETWRTPTTPPSPGLLRTLNPRADVVPMALTGDDDGTLWLAGGGGVFSSLDGGENWASTTFGDAGFNLLFASIEAHENTVLAGAFAPRGLLPAQYADLLSAVLLTSTDGGTTWAESIGTTDLRYITGLGTTSDGQLWLSALDGGLYQQTGDTWTAAGGPGDALGLTIDDDGVSVASASRGVWRLEQGAWVGTGDAPMVGIDDGYALDNEGRLYRLDEGPASSTAPGSAGGTVTVALSFHGNLYHSYRGDENTDDGYGLDLDVMRATLDWLDRHPQVHGDWDIENHFSLDGWMQTDGEDVLRRIQGRVARGQDDVRLMSWNNGAMANHTREEFDVSISKAKASLRDNFGTFVPGVQPQECMFTPDHIGWYRAQGIEWITLFNSGTGFTALRGERDLPEVGWYNPVTITDEQALPDDPEGTMVLVPVYHHADLINHGGLAGWVQQIHENHAGDSLLVIHFDADAESWTAFEDEIASIEDAPYIEFSTIQAYLDDHGPTATVASPMDIADGTGDGFQSWAEKDFNHEIATGIVQARETAAQASALAGDIPEVQAHIHNALEPRLLALSTTHFGLAAPTLHEDRMARARAYVDEARALSNTALAAALEAVGAPGPGEIHIVEARGVAGQALIETTVDIPAASWAGADAVHVLDDGGSPVVLAVGAIDDSTDPVVVPVQFVVELGEHQQRTFTWMVDALTPPRVGAADPEDTPMASIPVTLPFTECGGVSSEGTADGPVTTVDGRGARVTETQTWSLSFCDGVGVDNLVWEASTWDGLPGTVLSVVATLPDATGGTATPEAPWNLDAESVALSPLACSSDAETLTWQAFSGTVRSRPVRTQQWTWNGQAIDSWVEITCEADDPIQLAHAAQQRTSLAMLPMRNIDGQAIFAPLGTLWGPPIRHDVRTSGGHGMGDISTAVIGSQFRPAAPDWSGATVSHTLLLGAGEIDPGTLELFAHPPLVVTGPAPVGP